MTDELKAGDFVQIKGQKEVPFMYMVVNPVVDGVSPNVGGMTLVARWYKTDLLIKVQNK